MKRKIVFWGAGRIGVRAVNFVHEAGFKIDNFCDNQNEKIGTIIVGVKVISFAQLMQKKNVTDIYITAAAYEQIEYQLKNAGVKIECIHIFNSLPYWVKWLNERENNMVDWYIKPRSVLFELSNGLALGGIERWCFQEAERLKKNDFDVHIMVEDKKNEILHPNNQMLYKYPNCDGLSDYEKLRMSQKYIIESHAEIFIADSGSINFYAACMVAAQVRNFKIIAVVHSDEPNYYKSYTVLQRYISSLFVISKKIYFRYLSLGFESNKIHFLPWCIENTGGNHKYSSEDTELRIGYAGRVVYEVKRMDKIVDIAKILRMKGIDFQIDIAGQGNDTAALHDMIKKNDLEKAIHLVGFLSSDDVHKFWHEKDIMISCSEYEGHSITQCEAMEAGAVPIATDVSGVGDDIIDGQNGYLVDVDDSVNQIVSKIEDIYYDRKRLKILGDNARQIIHEKYTKENVMKLWNSVL